MEGICNNGKCLNIEGSYICTCDKGYYKNEDGICIGRYPLFN